MPPGGGARCRWRWGSGRGPHPQPACQIEGLVERVEAQLGPVATAGGSDVDVAAERLAEGIRDLGDRRLLVWMKAPTATGRSATTVGGAIVRRGRPGPGLELAHGPAGGGGLTRQ